VQIQKVGIFGISFVMYKEALTLVDWFMALRFIVTGAPPMNQYTCWPITFEIKGSYYLCGPLDGIMFHSKQCGSCIGMCL
jgi:hypothetical protein